jgi:ribonuclease D
VRVAGRPAGVRFADGDTAGSLPLALAASGATSDAAAPRNDAEWIDTPAALSAMSAELRHADIIGLDVETTLDFGTLCLVQVATRTKTFLIDPLSAGDLTPLVDVMCSAQPIKVIHNSRFERRVLATVGITIEGVFDTLEASRRLRGKDALGGHSLAMVCERELGLVLDKAEQTSNWAHRPLDADQLRYAALDAEVLLALYDRLVLAP